MRVRACVQSSVPAAARARIHQRHHQTAKPTLPPLHPLLLLRHLHPAGVQVGRGRHHRALHAQVPSQLVKIHVEVTGQGHKVVRISIGMGHCKSKTTWRSLLKVYLSVMNSVSV